MIFGRCRWVAFRAESVKQVAGRTAAFSDWKRLGSDAVASWVTGVPPVIIQLSNEGIFHEINQPAMGVPPFMETLM